MDKIFIFVITIMITWNFLTCLELFPRVVELERQVNQIEANNG